MDIIDWAQFEGIVDFADPECVEIYQEFADVVPEQLAELRQMCAVAEHAAVAGLAHRLRGSCLTFGLSGLCGVLTELECRAKAGGEVAPGGWYEQAVDAFEQAHEAISLRRSA